MSVCIHAVRRGESTLLDPSLTSLRALVDDPDVIVWVSLQSGDADAERILSEVFGFHPLLVEDVFADATTPKAERTEGSLYLIVHGPTDASCAGGKVETADVDLFLGDGYLITYHGHDTGSVAAVRRAVEAHPELLGRGPAYVAHAILDHMVDRFAPLMERLDGEIDRLERAVVQEANPRVLEEIFALKHALQRIRRISLHQKELLLGLWNGTQARIPEDARPFFRDVYDHFLRVADLTEGYRELVGSVLEAHLSMQSHRLNEVMRVLTVISTIMLPLTFITGLYGMNFDHMPGLHWTYGYEAAWVFMISTAALFYFLLKRRGWA